MTDTTGAADAMATAKAAKKDAREALMFAMGAAVLSLVALVIAGLR